MFERRDIPAPSVSSGSHAPAFVTHLAWASLAIPTLFLVCAGIWIAIRFGTSNVSPADLNMSAPPGAEDSEAEDDDDEQQSRVGADGEKASFDEADHAKYAAKQEGQMQPLLEGSDEEDDEDPTQRTDGGARTGRKPSGTRSARTQSSKSSSQAPAQSAWKLKPGYSTTTVSSSSSRKSKR